MAIPRENKCLGGGEYKADQDITAKAEAATAATKAAEDEETAAGDELKAAINTAETVNQAAQDEEKTAGEAAQTATSKQDDAQRVLDGAIAADEAAQETVEVAAAEVQEESN